MRILAIIAVLAASAAAAAVAGGFMLGARSANGAPPGLVDGRLAPCPGAPNCVSSEAPADAAAHVAPLPPSTADDVAAVVTALGGVETARDGDYMAFTSRSRIFGFIDDIEIRFTDDATHIRSASRVGHSDLGANRKRVEAIRARLGGGAS